MPELPHFNPSVSVFHFNAKVSNAKIAKYRAATERGMVASQAAAQPAPVKRRLVLNVRSPSNEGDNITVARSLPLAPAKDGKKRAWENAFAKDGEPSAKPSPAPSSDLSSADSEIVAGSAPLQSKSAEYGDFMSYYVMDDEDEGQPKASPPPKKKSKATKPISAHPQNAAPQPPQAPRLSPQPQHPPPNIMAPAAIDIRLREPDPIPVMIMKLEALSNALTEFGGAPPLPPSPDLEPQKASIINNLLAMFGGPDGEEKKPGESFEDLEQPGLPDKALTHGIQFIMNALKSWAEQRVSAMHAQMLQGAMSAAQRRLGRPKKSQNEPAVDTQEYHNAAPVNLFETPEGRAISAFRSAVESGCLRVNALMPNKLARALRHLYVQIDVMINTTPKTSEWRCLSYTAQIEANKIRVHNWRESQVKAQEEMIRQHQLSHQQMMRQLGIPSKNTSHMFFHLSQDPDATTDERRRQSHDLVRLPHIHNSANSAAQVPATYPGVQFPANDSTSSLPRSRSAVEPAKQSVSNSAFLPRSGQSMKFSFAPTSKQAIEAFGAQAFPPTVGRGQVPGNSTVQAQAQVAAGMSTRSRSVTRSKSAPDNPPVAGLSAINKQLVQ